MNTALIYVFKIQVIRRWVGGWLAIFYYYVFSSSSSMKKDLVLFLIVIGLGLKKV
jgi:hypothetical protein